MGRYNIWYKIRTAILSLIIIGSVILVPYWIGSAVLMHYPVVDVQSASIVTWAVGLIACCAVVLPITVFRLVYVLVEFMSL